MDKKDKIYISIIVILTIILVVTNVKIENVPEREPRTEIYIEDCEIWKICDYRESLWGCTMTECPEVYDCWEVQKNCKPQTQAKS